MGVDIGIITPCEFRDIRNKHKVSAFLQETAEHLHRTLLIDNINARIADDSSGEDDFLCDIYVPEYDADVYLCDGFWYFFNGFRFHQLTSPTGTKWLRCEIYDIVRALGQKEAWYCSMYDIEDEVGPEGYSLESWLEKARNSSEGIAEIDSLGDNEALARYYHDTFSDIIPLFVEMTARYVPNRLLGLSTGIDNTVRVESDGNVFRFPALFEIK